MPKMIPVPLSESELLSRGEEVGRLMKQRDQLEADKKVMVEGFNDNLKHLEERLDILGKELREKCYEVEAQQALPLSQAKKGKKGNGVTVNDGKPLTATVGEQLAAGEPAGDLQPAAPQPDRNTGKKRGRKKADVVVDVVVDADEPLAAVTPADADDMPPMVGVAVYKDGFTPEPESDEDEPLAELD